MSIVRVAGGRLRVTGANKYKSQAGVVAKKFNLNLYQLEELQKQLKHKK